MSKPRKPKRKASKVGWGKRIAPGQSSSRPTPVQAIELIHDKQARWLASRDDRFSQLLSRLITDEVKGQYLLSKGSLSTDEHAELKSLAPKAKAAFRGELQDAIAHLRRLLTLGDPL